ncbi:hypothetical protein C8J57DRAFT_1727675 [Mycena rebaudengoi]|nr:hypothetical protein C8J57DRAFT_1727675 [Mycena rebaudengoi]
MPHRLCVSDFATSFHDTRELCYAGRLQCVFALVYYPPRPAPRHSIGSLAPATQRSPAVGYPQFYPLLCASALAYRLRVRSVFALSGQPLNQLNESDGARLMASYPAPAFKLYLDRLGSVAVKLLVQPQFRHNDARHPREHLEPDIALVRVLQVVVPVYSEPRLPTADSGHRDIVEESHPQRCIQIQHRAAQFGAHHRPALDTPPTVVHVVTSWTQSG